MIRFRAAGGRSVPTGTVGFPWIGPPVPPRPLLAAPSQKPQFGDSSHTFGAVGAGGRGEIGTPTVD